MQNRSNLRLERFCDLICAPALRARGALIVFVITLGACPCHGYENLIER